MAGCRAYACCVYYINSSDTLQNLKKHAVNWQHFPKILGAVFGTGDHKLFKMVYYYTYDTGLQFLTITSFCAT